MVSLLSWQFPQIWDHLFASQHRIRRSGMHTEQPCCQDQCIEHVLQPGYNCLCDPRCWRGCALLEIWTYSYPIGRWMPIGFSWRTVLLCRTMSRWVGLGQGWLRAQISGGGLPCSEILRKSTAHGKDTWVEGSHSFVHVQPSNSGAQKFYIP